jgi:sulfur carrier protein
MRILLNNKDYNTESGSVSELLEELNCNIATVILTLNGDVLEKNKFNETPLKENDSVELFSFVGGG